MIVLDTDVLSLITTGSGADADRLRERVGSRGERIAVTIVTLLEQLRGRLAQCMKASTPEQFAAAALQLRETLNDYRDRRVLDFGDRAVGHFKRLKADKVRIGTMDLRIAAIVLANDATLVTRNLADFGKVSGLRAADWTARI
ncbi:MAG TPA: type II toxin-antitoxin system VapC family toxin [Fimbriiglobus sp.]|nr:type II toxin-antitoxin system VapC family toxin [Fimbriiglobus sp.]